MTLSANPLGDMLLGADVAGAPPPPPPPPLPLPSGAAYVAGDASLAPGTLGSNPLTHFGLAGGSAPVPPRVVPYHVGGIVDQLVAQFKPWHTDQTGVFAPDLIDYLTVWAEMFSTVEAYIETQEDGTPGYGTMMDPDRAPLEVLPWLAQWVGERLPAGLTEAAQRQWIKDAPNQIRGSQLGIARAAQRKLTNTKTVALHPCYKMDGTYNVDWLTLYTLDKETPDPPGTLADVLGTMPADIQLGYDHVAAVLWQTVESIGSWDQVSASGTWADVAATQMHSGGGWFIYTAAS